MSDVDIEEELEEDFCAESEDERAETAGSGSQRPVEERGAGAVSGAGLYNSSTSAQSGAADRVAPSARSTVSGLPASKSPGSSALVPGRAASLFGDPSLRGRSSTNQLSNGTSPTQAASRSKPDADEDSDEEDGMADLFINKLSVKNVKSEGRQGQGASRLSQGQGASSAAPAISSSPAASPRSAAANQSKSDIVKMFSAVPGAAGKLAKLQAATRGHLARKQMGQESRGSTRATLPASSTLLPDSKNNAACDVEGQMNLPPEDVGFTEEDTAHLTKIQANARGMLARKSLKRGTTLPMPPAVSKSARASLFLPMELNGVRVVIQEAPEKWRVSTERLAVKPNTKGLGYRKSKNLEDRAGPGQLAPWGESIQGSDAGGGWLECEILPDLSSYSSEDTARLTKIQAGARGRMVRKRAQAKAKAANHGQHSQGTGKEHPRLVAQGRKPTLPDLSGYSEEDAAKIKKIQASARGSFARKRVSVVRAQRDTEQGSIYASRASKTELPDLATYNQDDTAKLTKIQARVRGRSSRKQMRSSAQHGHESLPDLTAYSQEDVAKLTKIQASARGQLARKQAHGRANSKSAGQTGGETKPESLPDLAAYTQEDTAKLTKIQARARGKLARKQIQAKACAETETDLSSYSEADEAKLIRIQASARGSLTRKKLVEQRSAKQANASDATKDLTISADDTAKLTKLQALARGNLARKHAKEASKSQALASTASGVSGHDRAHPDGLVPVKPAGPAPNDRRPRLRPKPPPDPAKVLSEEALIKRAEKHLESRVRTMMTNMPGWRPPGEPFNPHASNTQPRVLLEKLSENARKGLLHLERKDAEAWLKEANMQAELRQQRIEVEGKLMEWHSQREAAKRAEEARKRALEQERGKAEQEQALKWKKRGEALSRKVANWGASKAEREEKQDREKRKEKEDAKKREADKLEKHQRRAKKRLDLWYAGELHSAEVENSATNAQEATNAELYGSDDGGAEIAAQDAGNMQAVR